MVRAPDHHNNNMSSNLAQDFFVILLLYHKKRRSKICFWMKSESIDLCREIQDAVNLLCSDSTTELKSLSLMQ